METEISKEVKRYLERELKDYKNNKKIIEELRNNIIDSSNSITLGVPRNPNQGNEVQTQKVYELMTNTRITRLENICYHIEKVIENLDIQKYEFYIKCFEKEHNKIKICMDMPISEKTYYRYKNYIIEKLAEELGFI